MKKKIIIGLLILLVTIIFTSAYYIETNYVIDDFENIWATLLGNQKGTSSQVIIDIAKGVIPIFTFTLAFLLFLLGNFDFVDKIYLKLFKKERGFNFKQTSILLVILLIANLAYFASAFKIYTFIYDNVLETSIYEDEYVDPRKVQIQFPKKKKNLIHIYLESMETSVFDKENRGDFDKAVTPELQELAKEGISFSDSDKLGGFYVVPGTGRTHASLMAQEAAINFKSVYGNRSNFDWSMPNIVSLGDILKDNGYTNTILMGSDGDFHNRKEFYEAHGYYVYDYFKALEKGAIPKGYKFWWGFEDLRLFEIAKDEITKLAKKDQPFNFSFLTVDTHFTDGFADKGCAHSYDQKYLNAYECSSEKVGKFVDWLRDQDFYEDTVIVITGDHFTMQEGVFDQEDRYVYNTFLNTNKTDYRKDNRLMSALDVMPTILSAMDVKIEGGRLGLGTDMFSDQETLLERYTFERAEKELARKSKYYLDLTQGD